MAAWRPDITDYSIFDDAKADFIVKSATDYLAGLTAASEAIDRKASSLLTILIVMITGITGYLVSECEAGKLACQYPALWYVIALDGGYVIASLVLAVGCLLPKNCHLIGSEPRHLLRNDVCADSAVLMKIGAAIRIQSDIEYDLSKARRAGFWLEISFMLTIAVPALILVAAVLLR